LPPGDYDAQVFRNPATLYANPLYLGISGVATSFFNPVNPPAPRAVELPKGLPSKVVIGCQPVTLEEGDNREIALGETDSLPQYRSRSGAVIDLTRPKNPE